MTVAALTTRSPLCPSKNVAQLLAAWVLQKLTRFTELFGVRHWSSVVPDGLLYTSSTSTTPALNQLVQMW
jgi:hypothetical protein